MCSMNFINLYNMFKPLLDKLMYVYSINHHNERKRTIIGGLDSNNMIINFSYISFYIRCEFNYYIEFYVF